MSISVVVACAKPAGAPKGPANISEKAVSAAARSDRGAGMAMPGIEVIQNASDGISP